MTAAHDPLLQLSTLRLTRLARRAERAQRRGPDAVAALAAATSLPAERLMLLADAWREGGRSGLVALGPAPPFPDDAAMRHAREVMERWRQRLPAAADLRWDLWRNRATLWHGDNAVAHLRRTSDGRWHLYRKVPTGQWWPVVIRGRRSPQRLDDCLAAIVPRCADPVADDRENGERRPDGVG